MSEKSNALLNRRGSETTLRQHSADDALELAKRETEYQTKLRRSRLVRKMSFELLTRKPLVFSLKNNIGALARALKTFKENEIQVLHIESRRSQRRKSELEVYVDCEGERGLFTELVKQLQRQMSYVQEPLDHIKQEESIEYAGNVDDSPWFPRKISDLNRSACRVLTYGADLDADHPGFKDSLYRKRRKVFADIAYQYRHGQPIPRVKYTEEETKTWGRVFSELTSLYPLYACKEYCENLQILRDNFGYREDNIPQLEDVSVFLRERTGFQIRPVAGYLSSRDFLAGLAFRVFHCTQYIRHASNPFYTPEPDCCHELFGHVPMLADKSFAQFSQEIGLASLGASDEDINKLASCYFFTIEFGLCKQQGKLKVYGAGLLSSSGELQHAMSRKAKTLPFSPVAATKQECRITTYQDAYFVSESFEEAKEMIRDYASTIRRPFSLRYNPYTQSVEILQSADQVNSVIDELKDDLSLLSSILAKVIVSADTERKGVESD
ncbi:tryptophan 5-hydroxylase 1-like [Acanthaster planci]|uniref:Tryptophan 5-hydroxylase 2 n=1 Tax=Acanthaster planci TaxID=133434 RepID=A0A8B7YMW2_ACAPL|nr:tryptophan 5-hydroxylase 1-like [Acanthaster planci]